jgi:cell division inhibitor SepF
MPKTLEEIAAHADELAERFEKFDPNADGVTTEITPLGEMYYAVQDRAASERAVADAVRAARIADVSWREIGLMLGTSAQAARQRYDRATRSADREDAAVRDVHELSPDSDRRRDYDEIPTVHARTYSEARTIGEYLRLATPVIMDLSEMSDAEAKRLIDFAAGLTFALRGHIERVTAKVFLLSPTNITVTAGDRADIAEAANRHNAAVVQPSKRRPKRGKGGH